jgi:hypothetical protein
MRDVIVGFFGFSSASPFGMGAPAVMGGGRTKLSGWECTEDAVDAVEAAGTGDSVGFEAAAAWGLLLAGVAMCSTGFKFGGRISG